MNELQALQNMAEGMNITVHEKHTQDKRKTVKTYFANIGQETISPVLDYKTLNHFLLGFRKAINIQTR